MTPSKLLEVGRLWSAALLLSTLLAAAGLRWPQPLPVQPSVVVALVLGPPLLMALAVLLRWRLPAEGPPADQGGE